MLDILFAEVETGARVSTTIDAAELAKTLGPVWFFAIVCFVACIILIVGLGWLFYKFGGKLMERLEGFLDQTTTNATKNTDNLASCTKVCGASAINIANLCDAGHDFANAIEKIGKESPGVHEDCEKIHEKLRTIMKVN